MGLNLQRVSFVGWLGPEINTKDFLQKLEEKLGKKVPFMDWTIVDEEYPRVGSYTAYGTFVLCLYYLTIGDFEQDLEKDDDIELEALNSFRKLFAPKSTTIPYVEHFLDTNDSDTIFLPIFFEKPITIDEFDLASLPAATQALESFAKACSFNLLDDYENEYSKDEYGNGIWIPFATVKNIARIIYKFFKEKADSCVAFS